MAFLPSMKNVYSLIKWLVYLIFPSAKSMVHRGRLKFRRLRTVLYCLDDAIRVHRFMRWDHDDSRYWKVSSELIFQYQKIEKGLCMRGKPRFFGESPVRETARLLRDWRAGGYSEADPVYWGAMESLVAYKARLLTTPPPPQVSPDFLPVLDRGLAGYEAIPAYATPCSVSNVEPDAYNRFRALSLARRSVRAYSSRAIDMQDVLRAVELAQLSPSACNRQPWRVHTFGKREQIDQMLELQNGNAGFGASIPLLLILTVDWTSFFDGSERNQPYIDGGLFAMSLMLGLQAMGISSCCLNWCVTPAVDRMGHSRGNIPDNERILMYLAIGYADEEAKVPRSARRSPESIIVSH